MPAPPFFLSGAVLFWAWHAQVLPLGAAMALALEAPRVMRTRWHLGPAGFARISDLCTWAFAILAGYLSFTRGMPIPILEIFKWLPLVMLPLMGAQLFSAEGRLPLSALFLTLRAGRHTPQDERSVDLSYVYAIVCALAAGAANVRHDSYYYGVALFFAWALWRARSPRYPRLVWALLFICAGALGYAGHVGLSRLQEMVMEATAEAGGSRTDPYRTSTDIGQIGELKQSNRIVLRVAPREVRTPLLLHTASYDAYTSPGWVARDALFMPVTAALGRTTWVLSDPRPAASSIETSQPVSRGKAILALPNGTVRLEQLPVLDMKRNRLGAVEIESHEDLVSYRTVFDADAASRDVPRDGDLRIPRRDAALFDELVARLELKGRPAREILAIVKAYFNREFTYSTYLAQRNGTSLADFLRVTHAGHCEYFATATTLLLRAAGLPARYATGYSVQEWSDLEQSYIARERHAHSWVRVHVDGRWIDFDTTPPVWFAAEAQSASRTQSLADLWSWASYRYARWQAEDPNASVITALVLIVPLAAILVWRLLIRDPITAIRARRAAPAARRELPGADSDFYRVEAMLARAGCVRAPHEPLSTWLARVRRERVDIAIAPLLDLLRLHYRYRFDPRGLDESERLELSARAQRWLDEHRALAPLERR